MEETNNHNVHKSAEERIREMEAKIAQLQKDRSTFYARSKLLQEELEHYRRRELRQDQTVDTLLERQRELHVMLNRSNIMLARAHEATAMLSAEFGELARALPAPDQASNPKEAQEVESRVKKINDLFKKTGHLSDQIAQTLRAQPGTMAAAGQPHAASMGTGYRAERPRPNPEATWGSAAAGASETSSVNESSPGGYQAASEPSEPIQSQPEVSMEPEDNDQEGMEGVGEENGAGFWGKVFTPFKRKD